MTKQKLYTGLGLYVSPIAVFLGVVLFGTKMMGFPLVLAVVAACLLAIYEHFALKAIFRRVNWDK